MAWKRILTLPGGLALHEVAVSKTSATDGKITITAADCGLRDLDAAAILSVSGGYAWNDLAITGDTVEFVLYQGDYDQTGDAPLTPAGDKTVTVKLWAIGRG